MGNAIAPAEIVDQRINNQTIKHITVHPAGHDHHNQQQQQHQREQHNREHNQHNNQQQQESKETTRHIVVQPISQPINQSNNQSNNQTNTEPPPEQSLANAYTGMTPLQQLFFAASHGDVDQIRSSVSAGADVNAQDRGYEAFMETQKEAVKAAKTKAAKKQLQEDEAQMKATPVSYDCPLHKAVEFGHLPSVELLYLLEANLEAKNKLGSTALHRAVACGKTDIVKYLLSVGARLTSQTTSGNTPLHIASYCGNVDIANVLLNHRKEVGWKLVLVPNASGLTPLDFARKKAMHELLSQFKMGGSANNSFVALKPEPAVQQTASFSGNTMNEDSSRRPSTKALTNEQSATPPQQRAHFQPNAPINTFTNEPVAIAAVSPSSPSNAGEALLKTTFARETTSSSAPESPVHAARAPIEAVEATEATEVAEVQTVDEVPSPAVTEPARTMSAEPTNGNQQYSDLSLSMEQ